MTRLSWTASLALLLLTSSLEAAGRELVLLVHNLSADAVQVDLGQGRGRGRGRLSRGDDGPKELAAGTVGRWTLEVEPRSSYEVTTRLTRKHRGRDATAKLITRVWTSRGRIVDVAAADLDDPAGILVPHYSVALRPAGVAGYLDAARAAYAASGQVRSDGWTGNLVRETRVLGPLGQYLSGGPPEDLLALATTQDEAFGELASGWIEAPAGGAIAHLFVTAAQGPELVLDHLARDKAVLAFPSKGQASDAGRAVDGKVAPGPEGRMATQGRTTVDPFWEVDLGKAHALGGVWVVGGGADLTGATLFVTGERLSPLAGLFRARRALKPEDRALEITGSGPLLALDLGGMTGRFLRLQRPAESGNLALQEFAVFPASHGVGGSLSPAQVRWDSLGGRTAHVAVGPRGQIQVLPGDSTLWSYTGTPDKAFFRQLTELPGKPSRAAVLPDGSPWVLTKEGTVERYLGASDFETLPDPEVEPADVATSGTGHVVVGGAAGLAGWDHGEARWVPLAKDPVARVALVPTGPPRSVLDPRPESLGVLVVTPEGGLQLYRDVLHAGGRDTWTWRAGRRPEELLPAGSAEDVAANAAGQVAVLAPGNGSERQLLYGAGVGPFPEGEGAFRYEAWPTPLSEVELGPSGVPIGPGTRGRLMALAGFRRVVTSQ